MKTTTEYIDLKPGDVRQEGDETRHSFVGKYNPQPGGWFAVSPGMFGKEILPADVIAADFRRRVK